MKRIICLATAFALLCCACLAEGGLELEGSAGNPGDVGLGEAISLGADSQLVVNACETLDRMGYYRAGQSEVGDASDYYKSGGDADYVVIQADILNGGDAERNYLDGATVRLSGEKRYAGWAFQLNSFNGTAQGEDYGEDSGRQNRRWVIDAADNYPIQPGGTGNYIFGCTVPASELDGGGALKLEISLKAGSFTYFVRRSPDAAPDLPVQPADGEEEAEAPQASDLAEAFTFLEPDGAAESEPEPDTAPLLPDLTGEGKEGESEEDAPASETEVITEAMDPDAVSDAEALGESTGAPSICDYDGGLVVETSSNRVNNDRSILVDGYCAVDGDLDTAWNSNRNTAGEWIRLSVGDGQKYEVVGFRVANGYWKSGSVYRNNARMRTVDVYCDEQYVQTCQLQDVISCQTFWLPAPAAVSSFTLVIRDGYSGASYRDCAVTELELIGTGGNLLSRDTLRHWGRSVQALETELDNGVSFGIGAKGQPVVGLQLILREGFEVLGGNIDGDFGPGTREAVLALADIMSQTLGDSALPMNPGVVDSAYWTNLLNYLDTLR